MTGLEIIRAPGTTAEQIADIVSEHCPPVTPEHCDKLSCRECWLAWLTTGEPSKEKGPSDERTTPDEEGLHPNLVEMYAKVHRRAQAMLRAYAACSSDTIQSPAPEQHEQPLPPVL